MAQFQPNPMFQTTLPTPIKSDKLEQELQGYDNQKKQYLVDGFRYGFRLGVKGVKQKFIAKNHKSVLDNREKVYDKLCHELLKGRIAGPFKSPPFTNLVCSPLGLVPKSIPGKFRLIHDLSYPKGHSVNSLIPSENSVVRYDNIDTVIQLVRHFGKNALMSKCDVEDAFRIICLHPADYYLLGFTWNNLFYYDKCLPMGASSSCQIFEKFSSSLQWVMENKYHAAGVSHVIDDFIFVGPPNSSKCREDLNQFFQLCNRIGVPIKMEKTVFPSTVITIYGIEVDSEHLLVRLPEDKVLKIRLALNSAHKRKKMKLKELQSLIGLLNFACLVVCPGRTFLRRLINLTIGVKSPSHFIRLTREGRADIEAWKIFIDNFNGKSFFLSDKWQSSDFYKLYTDAAGSIGYAAVFGSWWFAKKWMVDTSHYHITVKELFPIILALEIWGKHMQNSKVLFLSDNQAVVEIINKKSSRDKVLMKLIRRLVVTSMTHNILFRAKFIAGKTNTVADCLSRFQFQKARKVAPWLSPQETQIPTSLIYI